jgi:hypothetical protein
MDEPDEQTLIDIIVALDDPSEVENALNDLSEINAAKARELALNILDDNQGNTHLQACAFEVLYSISQADGLTYIAEVSDTSNAYLFRSMLESVTVDAPFVDEDPALLSAAKTLHGRAAQLTPAQLKIVRERLDWFREAYARQLTD